MFKGCCLSARVTGDDEREVAALVLKRPGRLSCEVVLDELTLLVHTEITTFPLPTARLAYCVGVPHVQERE